MLVVHWSRAPQSWGPGLQLNQWKDQEPCWIGPKHLPIEKEHFYKIRAFKHVFVFVWHNCQYSKISCPHSLGFTFATMGGNADLIWQVLWQIHRPLVTLFDFIEETLLHKSLRLISFMKRLQNICFQTDQVQLLQSVSKWQLHLTLMTSAQMRLNYHLIKA